MVYVIPSITSLVPYIQVTEDGKEVREGFMSFSFRSRIREYQLRIRHRPYWSWYLTVQDLGAAATLSTLAMMVDS